MLEIHNAIAAAWMRGSEADPSRPTNQRSSPAQSEIQMLILTRGHGETIRIGEDIAVKVIGVQGKQVRIGIAAPKTVVVNREEVHARTAQARSRLHPG